MQRFPDIWSGAFLILDDVKETVRLSGAALCQQLVLVTIILASSDAHPDSARIRTNILDVVIPPLLAGLNHTVKEVQLLSITTLLRLTECVGPRLKPFAPALIETFLQALSGMVQSMPSELNKRRIRARDCQLPPVSCRLL